MHKRTTAVRQMHRFNLSLIPFLSYGSMGLTVRLVKAARCVRPPKIPRIKKHFTERFSPRLGGLSTSAGLLPSWVNLNAGQENFIRPARENSLGGSSERFHTAL